MADTNIFAQAGTNVWQGIQGVWVWFAIIGGVVVVLSFIFLIWNRNKKLIYPVEEVLYFGNGKIGINRLRAGRMSRNTMFYGLIEMPGEKVMKTSDGRTIQYASLGDCHQINSIPGFLVKRKDDDPQVLVPISSVELKNMHMLLEVAPGDYRDIASRLLIEKENEIKKNWQKILEQVMPVIMIAVAFITIIMIINFASNQLAEARTFYREVFNKAPGYIAPSTAP